MAVYRLLFQLQTSMPEDEVQDFAQECQFDMQQHLIKGETITFLQLRVRETDDE